MWGCSLKWFDENTYADELEFWDTFYSLYPMPSPWNLTARICKSVIQTTGTRNLTDEQFIPKVRSQEQMELAQEKLATAQAEIDKALKERAERLAQEQHT